MQKKLISMMLLICMTLASCTVNIDSAVEASNPNSAEAEMPKVKETLEATVVAVGDIMFHLPQVREARTEQGYDFSIFFEKIKNYISGADVAIGNLETTINEKKPLSGFPRFNSPPEVVEGLNRTGFDVLVTANNHCMDTGIEGAENTAALIKKNNMIPLGVGENNKSTIIDANGIKLGLLAYTTSTNGLKVPEGFVSMADEEQIKTDIDNLKNSCDFIIVYMHAGVEYKRDVEEETARLFRTVADLGADCVLGSHPHVARRSELYYTGGREVLINYSMGNFLSNQNDKYTDIGTMTRLTIRKQGEETALKDFEIIPVYRHRFVDADGRVKRRVILTADIDSYSHISEVQKAYIRRVENEVVMLLKDERGTPLAVE